MSYWPKTLPRTTSTRDKIQTVAILGAGNMGTAMAQLFAGNGQRVHLWSIEPKVLEEVRDRHTNSKYVPGVELHPRIEAKGGLEGALPGPGWLFSLCRLRPCGGWPEMQPLS